MRLVWDWGARTEVEQTNANRAGRTMTSHSMRDQLEVIYLGAQRRISLSTPGGATLCVAHVDVYNGELLVFNLGDSGMMLIRDESILCSTPFQNHPRSNAPYQLVSDPADNGEKIKLGTTRYKGRLQVGDLLLLGTDGLWDNMTLPMIMRLIKEANLNAPYESSRMELGALARSLVLTAHDRNLKPDDITVLVARVYPPAQTEKEHAAWVEIEATPYSACSFSEPQRTLSPEIGGLPPAQSSSVESAPSTNFAPPYWSAPEQSTSTSPTIASPEASIVKRKKKKEK